MKNLPAFFNRHPALAVPYMTFVTALGFTICGSTAYLLGGIVKHFTH